MASEKSSPFCLRDQQAFKNQPNNESSIGKFRYGKVYKELIISDMAGTATTIEKGKKAEDHAAGWLESHGLRILARNWRHHHLELDIIAHGPMLNSEGRIVNQKQSFIHIVEVRSRADGSFVAPEQTILPHKQKLLINAADAFARSCALHEEVIFDVIGIEMSESGYTLTFTPDAFRPQW